MFSGPVQYRDQRMPTNTLGHLGLGNHSPWWFQFLFYLAFDPTNSWMPCCHVSYVKYVYTYVYIYIYTYVCIIDIYSHSMCITICSDTLCSSHCAWLDAQAVESRSRRSRPSTAGCAGSWIPRGEMVGKPIYIYIYTYIYMRVEYYL